MIEGKDVDTGNEISWYFADEVTSEDIGTGDGTEVNYEFDGLAAEYTEQVYVNSTLQVRGTDYTIEYRPTSMKSVITFMDPPGSGAIITAGYAKLPDTDDKALLSQDVQVDPTEEKIEEDVHGRDQKLKKTTGYNLKVTLNQVWGDTELIAKAVGILQQDAPEVGMKTWTVGLPNKVHLMYGRLIRSGELKKLYYLWGLSGMPSFTMSAKDFFRANGGDFTCDEFQVIEL
ncbi:MAG: hypothetical protein HXS43_11980 [Theionarchaea archaeon]|nr:hypothetical protein [Theionarchaea archaeon]